MDLLGWGRTETHTNNSDKNLGNVTENTNSLSPVQQGAPRTTTTINSTHDDSLSLAVETSGLVISTDHQPISSDQEAGDTQNIAAQDGNGSDYLLDSDLSDGSGRGSGSGTPTPSESYKNKTNRSSDTKQYTDHEETSEHYKVRSTQTKSGKEVVKTSSTGDLRMYHKTDIKNHIRTLEHHINQLDVKVELLNKHLARILQPQPVPKKTGFQIPSIIKIVGIGLLVIQIGRYC